MFQFPGLKVKNQACYQIYFYEPKQSCFEAGAHDGVVGCDKKT